MRTLVLALATLAAALQAGANPGDTLAQCESSSRTLCAIENGNIWTYDSRGAGALLQLDSSQATCETIRTLCPYEAGGSCATTQISVAGVAFDTTRQSLWIAGAEQWSTGQRIFYMVDPASGEELSRFTRDYGTSNTTLNWCPTAYDPTDDSLWALYPRLPFRTVDHLSLTGNLIEQVEILGSNVPHGLGVTPLGCLLVHDDEQTGVSYEYVALVTRSGARLWQHTYSVDTTLMYEGSCAGYQESSRFGAPAVWVGGASNAFLAIELPVDGVQALDPGNTLLAVKSQADVDLTWASTPPATRHDLWRGVQKGVWRETPYLLHLALPQAILTSEVPADPSLVFYKVLNDLCAP